MKVRSDLDLTSILPTSLLVPALNETLAPPPSPPSVENIGENQEEAPSDDNSN
jgi:hypothetical protein